MELMLFTCAKSIHINTDRKQFPEVDKSLFLAPPFRATSCNVHYSISILFDNERETWSKSSLLLEPRFFKFWGLAVFLVWGFALGVLDSLGPRAVWIPR